MGAMPAYSINATILLVLMYVVYKWLLASETFHAFNRWMLLSIYAIAIIVAPIVSFVGNPMAEVPNVSTGTMTYVLSTMEESAIKADESILPFMVVMAYFVGVVAMIVRSCLIWMRILRIVSSGEKFKLQSSYRLVIVDDDAMAPFSWRHYIIMNRADYEQASEMIITHEMQHLRLRHWLDLLIAEIVIIFNWFNPTAWLMRDELKSIHEYQADNAVLLSGVNAKNYQLLLIKKAVGYRFPSIANSLNHSKLKKRIAMMMKNQSKRSARMRALAIVPAVALAFVVINQPLVASALSSLGSVELPQTENKSSEKSTKEDTLKAKTSTATISVLSDSLNGKSRKIFINGKEVSTVELADVDNSKVRGVRIEKQADGMTIVKVDTAGELNSVVGGSNAEITQVQHDNKDEALVVVSTSGEKNIRISTKKEPVAQYDVYINGTLVPDIKLDTINPSKISSMKVDKSSKTTAIYIELNK